MKHQVHWYYLLFNIPLLFATVLLLARPIKAIYIKQFSPPTTIKLEMFALDDDGAKSGDFVDPHCLSTSETSEVYGCTWYYDISGQIGERIEVYPFDSHEIEIGYENEIKDGFQQGYLHNVIAQEMAEGSPLASYTAQAISSRTYAYNQTMPTNPSDPAKIINNSASYQVYIPYRYDGLGEGLGESIKIARKETVNKAIILPGPLYMTLPDSLDPIRAHFGADNCSLTEYGGETYLQTIYDPISLKAEESDNDPNTTCLNGDYGTPNGGLGSAGASRYGYGNDSSYGNGERWGVVWDSAFQILVHYFTGIVIRNAAGDVVTPEYRWNFLDITWADTTHILPTVMNPGESYTATLTLQNTGIITFDDTIKLVYYWLHQGKLVGAVTLFDVANLAPGAGNASNKVGMRVQVPTALQAGQKSTLVFDLWKIDDGFGVYFSNREGRDGKPWFPLKYQICIGGECKVVLPILLLNYTHTQDTYEPNDTFDSAYRINANIDYASYIWHENDEDWFEIGVLIPPAQARFIDIWLGSIPLDTNYNLELYTPTGNLLTRSNEGGNADEHIRQWVDEQGVYRVRVYSVDNSFSQSDSYTIRVAISNAPIK